MNLHVAQQIFEGIETSQLADFRRDLYQAAKRYAGMRVEWRPTTPDERLQIDAARTRAHDALIDTFNIRSLEQAKRGEDNSWRKALGHDRQAIGDMAAYIILFLALSAR
jgi:hypothetical protein